MAATMDTRVTLPNAEEFERAGSAIANATDLVMDLRWRIWYLADWNEEGFAGDTGDGEGRRSPGDEVPTFEQIGLIYSGGKDIEGRVDEIQGYVAQILKLVDDLDIVRSGPPELVEEDTDA